MNKSTKKTSNAVPDKHQTTPLTDTRQTDLTTDKLFVYGSLNNDYHFQLLTGHKLSTKEAILLNHKRIRPKGGFPFALRWKGSKIEGRLLYNVTKEILTKLDDYESEGQLYKRKIAKVQVNGEIFEAFVYVGKPKALKPYFQKGFAERDRIEEYVEKNVTRYLEGEDGRLIFNNPENLSVNVIRELLSEEIHSLMRLYFHDAGLPPFIIRHEIEKANIPNLNWLKTDSTARRYADNYIALAVRFMIFNQLEERFRDDYRSHLKVEEPYYLHTISAMVALKLLAKYHQQLETALLQLGVDRYVPDLQYTDYAVAAIYIAENLYTKNRADQIIDWVRSNRKVGMLPLGAELEFSNLGVRAVEAKEGEDPVYDSFHYFYDFDLMRRGWKLGAHVDDHGFLTSADIRTRGFLELAFGKFKLLGDISKPATQDPWILSNIIDLSIRFVNIKPHSLHLSIDIPQNTPFKKVENPELFLCLLLLGGDLREDQNGKLREMRVFRSEIYHQKGGLFFSRLNRHHNNPEKDKWSFVVEYQFPRLHYEYDYQPLIMALKGFQIEANPYPFRNCKDFPFQEYYYDIEANIKKWAANPTPISKETINEFLNLVEKGLDMEASIISKEYEKYCQRIIGRIEEQLKRRNKRIINYHAQFQRKPFSSH